MGTEFKDEIEGLIDKRSQAYTDISDAIWGFAEPRFQERESSRIQQEYLSSRGFSIRADLAGEETAFIAEYGSGKPVIAFLGEFDALSSLQQEPDRTERCPIAGKENGHGCGHHLLGTASAAAADALKTYMEEHRLAGTIRYYGCPAEENAGGKAYLVRDGYFDDCDIAITWHPYTMSKVMKGGFHLANFRAFFTFHGISSHAAGAPELGRSALDAVEIMDIGVNYMREHMIDAARVHGAITNSGGIAPNVIPSEAQILYAIRAPKVTQVQKLFERMCDIARGAALITGTTVDIKQVAAYSDLINNETLNDLIQENLERVVPIGYTEEELAYADQLAATYPGSDKVPGVAAANDREAFEAVKDMQKAFGHKMNGFLAPLYQKDAFQPGSTDVGDVSWLTPTAQIHVAAWPNGCPGHSWQNVSCDRTEIGHKAAVHAGKVLAAAAIDLMNHEELLKEAREEFEKRTADGFVSPIPADAVPVIPD